MEWFLEGEEEKVPLVRKDCKVTQEKVIRDRLRRGGTWTNMETENTHTEGRGNEDR